jgi:hypothetical protein
MSDPTPPGSALRTLAGQALTVAGTRRLDLVAQTLDDVQQRETRTFFETHLSLLQHCVQNQYPLDSELLAAHAMRWDAPTKGDSESHCSG